MAVVALYRVALEGKKCGLVHYTGQRFTAPVSEVFKNPTCTRCQIVNNTGPLFALADCRTKPAPRWIILQQPPQPGWVQRFRKPLDAFGSDYIARPYTDGSYDATATLKAYIYPLFPQWPGLSCSHYLGHV